MKRALFLIPLLLLLLFAGCNSKKPPSKVEISPDSATLAPGAHLQFVALSTSTAAPTVTWAATAGTIDQSGNFTAPMVGAQTTVTVTATSVADSSVSATATVSVNPVPAPTATFTTSAACTVSGKSATLSWNVTNATSVSIDNGIGTVSATGTKSVSPTATTTYTLTATGVGGTATQTVQVKVDGPLVIHAYDPTTGTEIQPVGGPYTLNSGQQVQFKTTGGCS